MHTRRTLGALVLWTAAVTLAGCMTSPTPSPLPTPIGGVWRGTAAVERVDIRILESFPVQVHVTASGNLPDGCTQIDEIAQARKGYAFTVTMSTVRPADAVCTLALVPFQEVIPLDVAGLPAGTYTVNLNGVSGMSTPR